MRYVRLVRGTLVAVLLAGSASAQAVYKDTKLGFSFKPPKDYKAIPVDPTEHVIVVKYQSDQTDYGRRAGQRRLQQHAAGELLPRRGRSGSRATRGPAATRRARARTRAAATRPALTAHRPAIR